MTAHHGYTSSGMTIAQQTKNTFPTTRPAPDHPEGNRRELFPIEPCRKLWTSPSSCQRIAISEYSGQMYTCWKRYHGRAGCAGASLANGACSMSAS